MVTNDDMHRLVEILAENKKLSSTLNASIEELTEAIGKIGSSPASSPAGSSAHEAYVKELVDTIKKGLEEGLTPLVEGMGRSALSGGGGGGGGADGGGGDGGGADGGGGGHDYVGAKNEIRIASQITGLWADFRRSLDRLTSINTNFADAREQQIEMLQSMVGSMQRTLVQYMSGKDLIESIGRQREESLEYVKSGLGGMLDTIAHNLQGAVDGFGRSAETFAGGAISFSQAVKLIQGTQSFYGRFDGDRAAFSRQMAESMDQVEQALRSRDGSSIYDTQMGSEFRQFHATLTDIYGLNVQDIQNAENLRRLDTPGNIARSLAQLEFLRQVSRNTGRSLEELQAMRASEEDFEAMNKAGLDENQSQELDQIITLLNMTGNTRMVGNIQKALEGISTGRGIAAFSEDSEALVRGEAQASLDIVMAILNGDRDERVMLRRYLQSVDQGNNLNIVGAQIQNRAMLSLSEQLDNIGEDGRIGDQHPMLERLGNMFTDYFENTAQGQTLAAAGGFIFSLTTATNLNTAATWALNMTMGANGPFAKIFTGFGEMFGKISQRLGFLAPLGRLFGLAGGATTAAAGSGPLMRMAGSLGGRVLGGVAGVAGGVIGAANGVDPMFEQAFQSQAAESAADAGSNWAKVLAGAATLFPATAIFGVVYTAIDGLLEAVFGAGLSDAIGFMLGGIVDFFSNDFSWDEMLTGVGNWLFEMVQFVINPLGTMFGRLRDVTEHAAEQTETRAEREARDAAIAAGRVIQLGAGNMQRVMLPNGQMAGVDLNEAARGLREMDDSQQNGLTDGQILQALLQGGRIQEEMVSVLRSIDRSSRDQQRNGVIYDTNTSPMVRRGT